MSRAFTFSFRTSVLWGVSLLGVLSIAVWLSGGQSDFDEVAFANQRSPVELESEFVNVGDVTLHVVFAGPVDGEPIVLLHGFPGNWFIWHQHMSLLAAEGHRVAAPDLRGYNRSDKPNHRRDYKVSNYASDVVGLLDSQNWEDAHIVGHDIGAHISWYLVFEQPARVASAVIFSVPHPLAEVSPDASAPANTYRHFFNLPILPELISRGGGLSMVAKNLKATSNPGTFSDETIHALKETWQRGHAFTTMLGFYRTRHPLPSVPPDGRPSMNVKYVFGLDDTVIAPSRARDTESYLGKSNVVLRADRGHWLILESPDETVRDILDFVSSPGIENTQTP